MDTNSAVIGSSGNQTLLTVEEFTKRLGDLVKSWKSHHDEGLEIRHKTGKLFNDHFGNPTERLSRGKGILKGAAKQLQLAESEISRMRRFAHHFESIQDLKSRYPNAQNWTAVKALLPKLKSKDQMQKKESSGSAVSRTKAVKKTSRQFSQVKQFLTKLSSTVSKVRKVLNETERKVLVEKFQNLCNLVSERLKIQVSVCEVSAEETPSASEVSKEETPSASEVSAEAPPSAA